MRPATLVVVPFILAAGSQASAPRAAAPVTIVGQVVDAACYMMHPQAASVTSHEECGRACAQRGVPLAVIDEKTKELYVADAASTKTLLSHLHKSVRITGHSSKHSEPLQLEMPVGEKHTMSVRVDGGYNALTVDNVASIPQGKQP
jgi:hypothetical protein